MNKLIETFKNTKANDLPKCKSIGNWFGWFNAITQFLYVTFIQPHPIPIIAPLIIFLHCVLSYYILRWIAIGASFSLFYFVELVSPRKEKSYLPNEPRED
jgi:hypothetical protein